MSGPATTCTKCRRVVFVTDVDDKGRCCFCIEKKADKKSDKRGVEHEEQ